MGGARFTFIKCKPKNHVAKQNNVLIQRSEQLVFNYKYPTWNNNYLEHLIMHNKAIKGCKMEVSLVMIPYTLSCPTLGSTRLKLKGVEDLIYTPGRSEI